MEIQPAKPAAIAPWQGGFSGIGRSTPMLEGMVAWQPPSRRSRPVPIGSRFIGVSLQPAIPRRVAPRQSPLLLHRSPTIVAQSRSGEAIKCAAQPHRKDAVRASATCLSEPTYGSILDVVSPSPRVWLWMRRARRVRRQRGATIPAMLPRPRLQPRHHPHQFAQA